MQMAITVGASNWTRIYLAEEHTLWEKNQKPDARLEKKYDTRRQWLINPNRDRFDLPRNMPMVFSHQVTGM